MRVKLDCRHYRGDKPCRFARGCEECERYAPMGTRILIVKLDAVGDVARTTTLLPALRLKYDPCHITWLVHPTGEELLRDNPQIDVLMTYTPECLERLRVERFDLVLGLDKTPRAAAVVAQVQATEKLGFGLSPYGTIYALNPEAEYDLHMGLDDELKFRRNTKTYQQILFESVRLKWRGDFYCLQIDARDREAAAGMLAEWGINDEDRVIGLNLGGGKAFAHKMWSAPAAVAFLKALRKALPCKTLLFGAEREHEKIGAIRGAGLPAASTAMTPHSCRLFQALLAHCAVVVTGDSLGLHMALAERRPVVALFGPTCPQEIELYGLGEKLITPVDCAPCYRAVCDREVSCTDAITPQTAVEAVLRWVDLETGARDR